MVRMVRCFCFVAAAEVLYVPARMLRLPGRSRLPGCFFTVLHMIQQYVLRFVRLALPGPYGSITDFVSDRGSAFFEYVYQHQSAAGWLAGWLQMMVMLLSLLSRNLRGGRSFLPPSPLRPISTFLFFIYISYNAPSCWNFPGIFSAPLPACAMCYTPLCATVLYGS